MDLVKYNPRIIYLFNGKRKSGKDYISDLLNRRLGKDSNIIRLSAPIKSHFAKEFNLDYSMLLSDSDYKERYRQEMIVWGERMRAADAGYFCRLTLEMSGAHMFPAWIVSDTRRRSDIRWFRQMFSDRVRTVHVRADLQTRIQRGFVFTKGVDDVESECDLDGISDWDISVENGEKADSLQDSLDVMLSWYNSSQCHNTPATSL